VNDDQMSPEQQVRQLLAETAAQEHPPAGTCLRLAKLSDRLDRPADAVRWAFAASDASEGLVDWMAAAAVVKRCLPRLPPLPRQARVAVLGSYTTTQFAALLPLAAARCGVAVEVYEAGYGQYRREVLDPAGGLAAFDPDVVVLAVHAGEVDLPALSADPENDVERELARWTSLWATVRERWGARVIQHNIALPPEEPLGNLTSRVPASRGALLRRLNARLGEAAGDDVLVVDCDQLASLVGRRTWFDARYWFRSKQAVSLACVPLLARHTAAVLGAALGQSKKCLVLDLDNTLWGGVLGEDGIGGVRLGQGEAGEAFSAFQRYVLELKARGVVLAVASKNNPEDVREMFVDHPDMAIGLDDVALLSAGWDDKATQLRRIADTLGLGLDSLVFVDDNPAEREVVRQLVPEVDVLPLPADPAGYVRALADYPFFEPAGLTAEDAARTEQYRARARTAELHATADSLEDFLRGLDMVATVVPLDDLTLPRVTQLIAKTNQFNLTGRRRNRAEVEALAADPACVTVCVRLRDRFADHGLVGVLLALVEDDGSLVIDTWLLSCRVIGRRLENRMLALLADQARARGCDRLRGSYVPTAKNALVADLYPRLGFQSDAEGRTDWVIRVEDVPPADDVVAVSIADLSIPHLERTS
jgi:FkbH-like protein